MYTQHCPVSNSSCKQISIFMAAVLFCIYSSLAMMIIFKAQMCFIVLRVNDQYLQSFWLLLIFIREIKTHENEMLWTSPVPVFIAWEWAIMTPDRSRLIFPVHQKWLRQSIGLYQRGFMECKESCCELLGGVIRRHFPKLQSEDLICIAFSVDRRKII